MSEFLKPLSVDLSGLSSLTSTRQQIDNIKIPTLEITAGALSPGFSKPNKFQEVVNNFKASNATMMAEVNLIKSRLDGDIALAKQTAGAQPELVKVADLTGQDAPVKSDNSAPSDTQAKKADEKRQDKATEAKRDDRLAAKDSAKRVADAKHSLAEHAQEVAEKDREKAAKSRGIAV